MPIYNTFIDANAPALLVYILEKNYLSARYFSRILAQEPGIATRIVPDIFACSESPLENRSCILVMDQCALPAGVSSYLERARRFFPDSTCVFMGPSLARQDDVEALISKGVLGFVAYTDVEEKLALAVRSVAKGACWMPGNLALSFMPPKLQAEANPTGQDMTRREKEILDLMVTYRFSNKEIASRLEITETTVKFHVSNIFAKMKVNRRRELMEKFNGSMAGETIKAALLKSAS